MKFASAVLLIFALAPSAYLAWSFRDMPQFGEGHDDALMFASAKSFAAGRGYRIASLPGEPFQTKYPPLYPALLAMVWRLDSSFPENLKGAMTLAWAPLPFLAVACAFLYRRWGESMLVAAVLAAIVALNPYTVLFALSFRTELVFSTLLIAALLLLDRRPELAGVFAGLAYITRTAGIALLIAVIAIFVWRREFRKAARFLLTAAPFAFAWTLWVRMHKLVTDDANLLYYLDYLRFGLSNQNWSNIYQFVWTNAWAMLEGAGALLLVEVGKTTATRAALIVAAAAMLAGLARSRRTTELHPYTAFAIVYCGILLFWHFPPGARFLYPILPLLLYGAFVEARRLILAAKESKQRVASGVIVTAMAFFVVWMAWAQFQFLAVSVPANLTAHRERLRANVDAFRWIEGNVPAGESILAPNDAQLYLYTGRHAMNIITPPAYFYENRKDKVLQVQYGLVDFALRHQLRYIYFDTRFRYYLNDAEQMDVINRVQRDSRVRVVYNSGLILVCELIPGATLAGLT
jgi:hypothetical protein